MTTLRITVTKEILERSKHCGTPEGGLPIQNCAIALSVRDIFPNASVSGDYIRFISGADLCSDLPREATEFIRKFDKTPSKDRIKLPELTFEIEIPDTVIDQISINELKPLLENHPTLQLV